jgi:hypothetical protein
MASAELSRRVEKVDGGERGAPGEDREQGEDGGVAHTLGRERLPRQRPGSEQAQQQQQQAEQARRLEGGRRERRRPYDDRQIEQMPAQPAPAIRDHARGRSARRDGGNSTRKRFAIARNSATVGTAGPPSFRLRKRVAGLAGPGTPLISKRSISISSVTPSARLRFLVALHPKLSAKAPARIERHASRATEDSRRSSRPVTCSPSPGTRPLDGGLVSPGVGGRRPHRGWRRSRPGLRAPAG